MLAHEGLNAQIPVPLLALVLVAADVHVRVWEECGHLAEESVEELVDLLARWVERGFKDSGPSFYTIRPRRTSQLRVADEPTRRVARHVELGHDAYAALARVGDYLARLRLRVEEAVGAEACETRKFFALDAEALIFREVPVKDVELDGGHRVEVAF